MDASRGLCGFPFSQDVNMYVKMTYYSRVYVGLFPLGLFGVDELEENRSVKVNWMKIALPF